MAIMKDKLVSECYNNNTIIGMYLQNGWTWLITKIERVNLY